MADVHTVYVSRNRYPSPWACKDCGDTHYQIYMVHDTLWAALVPEQLTSKHVFLCLICLTKRAGRPLMPADFKPGVPVNANIERYLKEAYESLADNP